MKSFLDVKSEKFIEDFKLSDHSKNTNWKRFVNYHFFHNSNPGVLTRTAA